MNNVKRVALGKVVKGVCIFTYVGSTLEEFLYESFSYVARRNHPETVEFCDANGTILTKLGDGRQMILPYKAEEIIATAKKFADSSDVEVTGETLNSSITFRKKRRA